MRAVCALFGVKGCVIVSTCNRSEVYISSDTYIDSEKVFLKYCGVGAEELSGRLKTYSEKDAVYHLIETACGLNSAIVGESRIIGQIRESADLSRQNGCMDGELEVLFRIAVTVGKKACGSSADGFRLTAAFKAAELAERELGSLAGKKCLVIGNGKVGVLAAELFIKKGAEVVITLREYKRGRNVIPDGCGHISYADRLKALAECDIVLSATKSPHFTLTEEMTEGLSLPKYMFDLAVPRDIDPDIAKKHNVRYFNIDDFVSETEEVSDEVYNLIEDGVSEYFCRSNFRESLELIRELKNIIAARIVKSEGLDPETVAVVSEKTVDMLLGGINGAVTPELMKGCLKKIKERSRL